MGWEEPRGHTLWVICCLDLLSVLAFVVGSVARHPQDIEKTLMKQNFSFPFGPSVSGLLRIALLKTGPPGSLF